MIEAIILKIYEEYGLMGIILVIISVIALSIFIKLVSSRITGFFRNWWKLPRNKENIDQDTSDILSEHMFFGNTQYKIRVDIPNLLFYPENERIERVYRDLLYMTVESFYYGCKRIIETQDLSNMSVSEWSIAVKTEVASMLNSFERKAQDFGCPLRIIRQYNQWFKDYINILNSHIDQLANSSSYRDNILRTNVFLLIMNLLITTMIGDIRKVAVDSADDIKGIEYRGQIL